MDLNPPSMTFLATKNLLVHRVLESILRIG